MASAVHKNTETKAASVNVNSVCRQNTAEQGMAAPDEFMAEVQWSMAIRKMIAKLEFGDALKLLMNDRDMSVENMESESGLSVSTEAASCGSGGKRGTSRCHFGGIAASANGQQ